MTELWQLLNFLCFSYSVPPWRCPTRSRWPMPSLEASQSCSSDGKEAFTSFYTENSWSSAYCTASSVLYTGIERFPSFLIIHIYNYRSFGGFIYLFKANSVWAIVQHKCNSSIHVASYRCVLNNEQQEMFERLARHCNKFAKLIPMSFVLGEHKCSDHSNMILLTPWIPYNKLNWSVVLVRVLCHTGVPTLVGSIYKLPPAR